MSHPVLPVQAVKPSSLISPQNLDNGDLQTCSQLYNEHIVLIVQPNLVHSIRYPKLETGMLLIPKS